MKKRLAQGVGVAAVLVSVCGSGVAGAVNEYKGLTYEKAAASISRGGTPVIASRIGSYLPTEKCIVTGSRTGGFLDSSGNSRRGIVLLDLNCNAPAAASGHPGNSAATPEGKDAMKWISRANNINKDFAKAAETGAQPICAKDDTYRNFCIRICETSGKCSGDVLDFLGL
ncbi:hypothetical protein [Mycolicibacterium sp.]|uniref:hypothetical protein n=1 Tax=Mycolicibacterium sp. TaxID=2320850 RepID=UPI0028A830AA|nr:hypothetical protein [Mycolicibacterium sp.]